MSQVKITDEQQELKLDVEAPENNEKNKLKWKHFLWFISLYLGAAFGIVILIFVSLIFFQKITGNNLMFLVNGYYGLIWDALVFSIIFLKYKSIRRFVMQSVDFTVLQVKRTYLYILAGLFALWLIEYIIMDLFHIGDATKQIEELGISGNQVFGWFSYLLMYLAIGVITPIKEELIFRGVLYRFLEQRYRFWIGLVASSVIFGLLHFDFPLVGVCMGVVFALLYYVSRSLVPSIIVHMVWNLLFTIINSIEG